MAPERRFQVPDEDEPETEIRFSEAYVIHHEIEVCQVPEFVINKRPAAFVSETDIRHPRPGLSGVNAVPFRSNFATARTCYDWRVMATSAMCDVQQNAQMLRPHALSGPVHLAPSSPEASSPDLMDSGCTLALKPAVQTST